MTKNKLIPVLIMLALLINTASALTTYEETSAVSRIVGESPTEMIRQMQRDRLDIDHATFFGFQYETSFNDKKSILDKQFADNKYIYGSEVDIKDLKDKVNNFEKNEMFIAETTGDVEPLHAGTWTAQFPKSKLYPNDLRAWQLSFETNNPLMLWDSPYSGSYLPKEDTFISRLVGDSTIIAPTSFNSPQFTKSFLCQLLDEKTIGEVFKDARNFHYNGGSISSGDNLIGLVLQSYALYGNPNQIIDMDWSEADQEKIKDYCSNFLENLAPNIEFLEQIGNYSKFRKHLVFEIPSYTIGQIENFSIINAENTFQSQEYGELVLPIAVRTTHFPTNTIITNFSLDYVNDFADLNVNNLPSYESDFVNRTCYEDYANYTIDFESAYAENSYDFIARINPIEIINCTEGKFRLYKKFNYSVDYIALSPVLIKKINAPILLPANSIANVSVELMPLTNNATNGSLAIFDQNNNKMWEEETTTNITNYNASFIAPSEEGIYKYSVEFIVNNETLNYDGFSLFAAVLEPRANISASLSANQNIEINFYSYSDKNFDLNAKYYLTHSNDILNEGEFTKTISQGDNQHTLSFSNLKREDQSYALALEINYLGQGRTVSYLLATNNVPIIYAVTESIVSEGDKAVINYTALDYDGDSLTVSINDSRFVQNNGLFEWQTDLEDEGTYDVLLTATDGILSDTQALTITINEGCIPNWVQENNSCLINDTNLVGYIDANNCNSNENLPADNGTYQSCDYCSFSVINTTWTEWRDQTSCLANDTKLQNRSKTEYDENYGSCYAVTRLESDLWNNGINNTFYDYQDASCDYCTPSWQPVNTSCNANNNLTTWHNDTNNCYALTSLPSDNNPPENKTYSCDYNSGEPPIINILSPVNNTVYNTNSIDLNWTSNKDLDWCAYSLNNGENNTNICLGGMEANISFMAIEGINNLTIYGNDSNGITGQSDYVYFTINNSNCNNGETRLCEKQLGICANSFETCSDSKWINCTETNYLSYNSSYETEENSCDALDNDCDGQVDEGCEGVWALHLADMPYYIKENKNFSGAASAKMILDFLRTAAGNSTLSQQEIYDYARTFMLPENNNFSDLDPQAIDYVLGHYDPYDTSDPSGQGDAYTGYNFDIEAYYPDKDPQALSKYMRDIIHWMAYNVTIGKWYTDDPSAAEPNTPAALPLFGDYNHWIVVNGGITSENPAPFPHTNPWLQINFTVYGYWLTDPAVDGIGQHIYVTAQEAASTYFMPVISNDSYNASYVQIAEPPPIMSTAAIEIAEPFINSAVKGLSKIFSSNEDVIYAKGSRVSVQSNLIINWEQIIDPALLQDESFINAFKNKEASMPIKVHRVDTDDYYYIISFGENQNTITATIILDDTQSFFKQASWTDTPEKYLPIGRVGAIYLVEEALGKELDNLNAELIWQPKGFSPSPFKPYWKVEFEGQTWFVTQEKEVIPTEADSANRLPIIES